MMYILMEKQVIYQGFINKQFKKINNRADLLEIVM